MMITKMDMRALRQFAHWPHEWAPRINQPLVGRIELIDSVYIPHLDNYVHGLILLDEKINSRVSLFLFPHTELFSFLEYLKPKVGDRVRIEFFGIDRIVTAKEQRDRFTMRVVR